MESIWCKHTPQDTQNRWMNEWMNGWMDGWMDGWIDGQTYMKKTIIQNNSSSNNSNSSITVSILTTHCVVRHILYYITNASVVSATASPPIHSLSLSLSYSLYLSDSEQNKKRHITTTRTTNRDVVPTVYRIYFRINSDFSI